jgi:phosphoglucan,water dikinase
MTISLVSVAYMGAFASNLARRSTSAGVPKSPGRITHSHGRMPRGLGSHTVGRLPVSMRLASAAAVVGASAEGEDRTLTFKVRRRVNFGECVKLVGDSKTFGKWSPRRSSMEMVWTDGDVWEVVVDAGELVSSSGAGLEFKCVVVKDGADEFEWEGGENHAVDLCSSMGGTAVVTWGKRLELFGADGADGARSALLERHDNGNGAGRSGEAEMSRSLDLGSSFSSMDDAHSAVTLPLDQWSGDDIVFMQSNEHPRERQGTWDVDGLSGASLRLVQGDRDASNWLKKLELARDVIVDRDCGMRPDLEVLASSFVYLTWVSNGSIRCVEGGGHHRPNHHARLSMMIFRSLEWIIGERTGTPDALFARRLQTRIPSFTDEFMQSTPLTRIRDIAHRNDIPQDLKREIKHTIQNKLHRNAGPEDLAASESLLRRIMDNRHEYNEDFVNEYQLFMKELRDFFNAGSLEDALLDLGPSLDDDSSRLVEAFILAKRKVDSMSEWDDNTAMDCMHALTTVRAVLSGGLSAGLRNDAPDNALAMRQKWRLAEIRAEDYIFMLMSRFINTVEERGGAEFLATANDGSWALPIGALVLSLRQIGLTGYSHAECMALENELTRWQQIGGFGLQDEARRMCSTLNRVLRLTESFCSVVIDNLNKPAMDLGRSLGVEHEKAAVFAESEIRSNVTFQTSKLATLLLKAARVSANMPQWQIIRHGNCSGVLVEVDELSPDSIARVAAATGDKNFIAVVKTATGDEELVSLSNRLQGVVLLHDIPHLSHLGVRARQEKLTFVATDDADERSSVIGKVGQAVVMEANGTSMTIHGMEHAQPTEVAASVITADPVKAPAVVPKLSQQANIIPLSQADIDTSGAKSCACRELVELSKEANSYFRALDGLVVPYGSLESVIAQNSATSKWAALLDESVTELEAGDPVGVETICDRLQDFVMSLTVPKTLAVMIGGAVAPEDDGGSGKGQMLMLRSSANVEDLAGLSGAGLYDSIRNVRRDDPDSIEHALKEVWASLFSRRAMLARASLGIHPKDAHMAVLIQPQLAPTLSFVLHTSHPLEDDALLAELAPGHGEILASGTRGSGWRLTVSPSGVASDSFANFSEALLPNYSGTLTNKTMDYSREELSCSSEARERLGKQLGVVGKYLEASFGDVAQDVEGAIVGDALYVFQTRPQP